MPLGLFLDDRPLALKCNFLSGERDPEYRALLDACLDQVREHSESIVPGMGQRDGSSSSRRRTP